MPYPDLNSLIPLTLIPHVIAFLAIWLILSLLKIFALKTRLIVTTIITVAIAFTPVSTLIFNLIPPAITSSISFITMLIVFVIGIILGRHRKKPVFKVVPKKKK